MSLNLSGRARTAIVAGVILGVAVSSGCGSEASGVSDRLSEPAGSTVTTATTQAEAGVEWVVTGSGWTSGPSGETYSVICVHGDVDRLDPAKWNHGREVKTDKATSDGWVDGAPCPTGEIIREW